MKYEVIKSCKTAWILVTKLCFITSTISVNVDNENTTIVKCTGLTLNGIKVPYN